MSTFSGLNAATTALWAHRRALDVTGQNIANVNTDGYSRQRADLQAIGGSAVPAFYSKGTGIGGGVNADSVLRIRDAFLEGRGHTEHANNARLTAENEALTLVEQAFREPGDTGIQTLLSDMWAGWEDVANNPGEPGARGQVLQRLDTLVDGLNFSHTALGAQWDQSRDNLEVLVKDVNAAAVSIARLNQAIQRATQSGLPANDLADQRDVLVMKVAEQVGAVARPGKDGMTDVIVGGISLVAGSTATAFAVAGTLSPDNTGADPVRIVTAAGGYAVTAGGTAAGQLTGMNSIVPGYRKNLDDLAAQLATELNTQHMAGYDLSGSAGVAILESSDGGPISASNLRVAISDTDLVAASSIGPDTGNRDSGNADKIAQLRQSMTGVDATYRRTIVELGVQAAVSERTLGIQQVITTQVDAARESVAGVNLDEEMTNMLASQHAYAAAGRLVSAIDETLDVLINRTGIVGR